MPPAGQRRPDTAYGICPADSAENRFRRDLRTEDSRPPSVPESRSDGNCTETHKSLYKLWCVCPEMSCRSHQSDGFPESGQESLYFLHALCSSLPSFCPQNQSLPVVFGQCDAQKSLFPAESERTLFVKVSLYKIIRKYRSDNQTGIANRSC